MKKKLHNKLTLLTIFQVCVLLIVSSYAWFSDKSSPSINQNNIKVTSAEGLVIKLAPDSEGQTEVKLDQILGDMSEFELKQMSTTDTENFYTIDFGAGLANVNPKFVQIAREDNGHFNNNKWGILDFDFYLQTEDLAKHVYLHKDTSFSGIAKDSIRMAISFEKDGLKQVIIFGTNKEDGRNYPYQTKAIVADGEFDFFNIDSKFIGNQNVHLFTEKDGGRTLNDNDPIDLSKILLTLDANSSIKINVKVWLEGGDPSCNNTISSTLIDMLLKFGSANVLLDAPNLSANNTKLVINGLTTDMEYSYTNDNLSTWYDVTDSNMKFERGTTVYVRIKEVVGVSPSSYITKVVFN